MEGDRLFENGSRIYPDETSFSIPLSKHDVELIMAGRPDIYKIETPCQNYFEVIFQI